MLTAPSPTTSRIFDLLQQRPLVTITCRLARSCADHPAWIARTRADVLGGDAFLFVGSGVAEYLFDPSHWDLSWVWLRVNHSHAERRGQRALGVVLFGCGLGRLNPRFVSDVPPDGSSCHVSCTKPDPCGFGGDRTSRTRISAGSF